MKLYRGPLKERHLQIGNRQKMPLWYKKEYREPKKGEHYLSGAIPTIYYAKNDIPRKYWVMEVMTPDVHTYRQASLKAAVADAATSVVRRYGMDKEEVLEALRDYLKQVENL